MKKKRGTRGAVSVFLAIILVPCIVVSSIFVDVSRVQLSKTVSESSADLALNSLLTNYDADLKEWYGMIASCQNIQDFYESSANLFVRTLKSQGLSDDEIVLLSHYFAQTVGNDKIYDLLSVEPQSQASGMIGEVSGANLSNAALIKDQVVEFMKYRAPIEISINLVERFKNIDPTLEEAFQADANEDLVEDKQDFYESEAKMYEASYESYKAIKKYYTRANTDKLTNDWFTTFYGKLAGYQAAYTSVLSYVVTYQSGAENLPGGYTRPNRTITYYNDLYSNPSRNFSEVYSKKEKVDGETTYYIELSRIKSLVDDLSSKITAFKNAKTNYANAVSSALSYLPFDGTASGSSNTTRWCLKMYNAVYKSGTNYHSKVQTAGDEMLRAYSRVKAISKCDEIRGSLPKDWNSLDDWYAKYGVGSLLSDAEKLQARYLKTGVRDDSDTYLKAVSNFESACSSSNSLKNKFVVTVDGTARKPADVLKHISSTLTAYRKQLKEISDLLDVAINGKGKTPALSDLETYVNNYDTALTEWENSSKNTYHKGKLTEMAGKDQVEIKDKKAEGTIIDIKKKDVTELKTRLTNIKKQLDDAISAIDSMKWGGKAIKDIDSLDTFKSKAGIDSTKIGLSNKEVTGYASRLAGSKFTPETAPTFKHGNDSAYNPVIDPVSKQVDTPELWVLLHDKYGPVDDDEVEKHKGEKDSADKAGKNKATEAKEKTKRYTYSGANVKHEYSVGGVFELTDLASNLMSFVEAVFEGESALVGMRDNLYVTTYIMEMFSHVAYEKEGQYNLLSADVQKTLTLNGYADEYKKVAGTEGSETEGTWASTKPKDHYNKTLTNKQITTANNAAYCAEIEYILCGGNGKTNEDNAKAVFNKIYTIRYPLNLVSGFQHFWSTNTTTGKMLDMMAVGVSGGTGGIIPAAAIKAVIIPVFAIFETANDMDRLQAGFPVELYKNDAKLWMYSFETGEDPNTDTIGKFMSSLFGIKPKTKPNPAQGLFYSDYLTIFVYLGIGGKSGNAMLQRMAEVIQFNIATMSKDSGYSLKKSRMYFTLVSELRVKPLMIDLPIFTNNGYAPSLSENLDWCTYDIKLTRGYS